MFYSVELEARDRVALRELDFKSYLKVPRDSETLTRSIQRKFYRGYNFKAHSYISGDSFKAACDLELSADNWHSILMSTTSNNNKSYSFFIPGGPRSKVSFEVVEFLESTNQYFFPNVTLLFHNGDSFPEPSSIQKIANQFKKVYAVNWLGDAPNIAPIPIGLENEGYLLNGVLSDYLSMVPKLKPWSSRDIQVLVCFSVHTNLNERSEALYFARQIDGALIVDKPVTPRQYRELLSNSKFVISPPGNGIDCHRTWESMFLGAIPIVKKSFWPFSKFEMNIRILDAWEQLPHIRTGVMEIDHNSFYEKYAKVENWLL